MTARSHHEDNTKWGARRARPPRERIPAPHAKKRRTRAAPTPPAGRHSFRSHRAKVLGSTSIFRAASLWESQASCARESLDARLRSGKRIRPRNLTTKLGCDRRSVRPAPN